MPRTMTRLGLVLALGACSFSTDSKRSAFVVNAGEVGVGALLCVGAHKQLDAYEHSEADVGSSFEPTLGFGAGVAFAVAGLIGLGLLAE
jgi:hypothetical protein